MLIKATALGKWSLLVLVCRLLFRLEITVIYIMSAASLQVAQPASHVEALKINLSEVYVPQIISVGV